MARLSTYPRHDPDRADESATKSPSSAAAAAAAAAAMDTSYLTQQVNHIVGQLHGLFDEMGVPAHERDSREAEVRRAGV
jgi:hypothetical protein